MTAIRTHFSKALIVALAGGLAAYGATLSGTITGGKGAAVVYIDTIPGKTFPAPDKHIVEDQKSLLFQPHVIVVLAGSTVDFLNSDTVQHNIFWPSISGNKKMSHNMGTWPKAKFVRSSSTRLAWFRCCATCIPRCPVSSLSRRRPFMPRRKHPAHIRSRTFRTAAIQ